MINVQIVFKNTTLPPFKVAKDELEIVYVLESESDNDKDSNSPFLINLDLFPDFSDVQYSDIVAVVNAFTSLLNLQYNLPLPYRMGSFDKPQLLAGRLFFNSMSTVQRITLLLLVNIVGNERMSDLVTKLFAERLAGKSMKEVKEAIGY